MTSHCSLFAMSSFSWKSSFFHCCTCKSCWIGVLAHGHKTYSTQDFSPSIWTRSVKKAYLMQEISALCIHIQHLLHYAEQQSDSLIVPICKGSAGFSRILKTNVRNCFCKATSETWVKGSYQCCYMSCSLSTLATQVT